MESRRYCIYNKTTDRFLSVGATVVDAAIEPVESLEMPVDVENVTADWGLCLTPGDRLPTERISFSVDVVYLDAERRVLQCSDWEPGEAWPDGDGEATSLLIVPFHSVLTSRTHPGDQFIICEAEELVRHLARVPAVKGGQSTAETDVVQDVVSKALPNPVKPAAKSKNEKHLPKASKTAPRVVEIDWQVSAPTRFDSAGATANGWQIDAKYERAHYNGARQTDLEVDEIESVVSQVLQWSRTADTRAAAVPLPVAPPPLTDDRPLVEKVVPAPEMDEQEDALATTDASEDDLPPSDLEDQAESGDLEIREDEEEKSEFDRSEIDSVVSQVLRWAQETGRPVVRVAERESLPVAATQVPSGVNRASRDARRHDQTESDSSAAQNTAKRGPGAETPQRSWFSRWAEEFTHPLTSGLRSRPTVRMRIATHASPTIRNGSAEDKEQRRVSSTGAVQAALQKVRESGKSLLRAEGIHTLKTRFVHWLDEDPRVPSVGPVDRRRSSRHSLPDLIAYYWTGGTPQAHRVGDISCNGFYLLTDERWVPETVIRMTLQRTGANKDEAISVLSKVVRWGDDGVGHEFILSDSVDMRSGRLASGREKVQEALQEFL